MTTLEDSYDYRSRNAQGRDISAGPHTPYPLVGFDMRLDKDGLKITDLVIRNARTDLYEVGLVMEILDGKKWKDGQISWLNVGASEAVRRIEDSKDGVLSIRVWCHEDFREENIITIQKRMATMLVGKMESLRAMYDMATAKPANRHRP